MQYSAQKTLIHTLVLVCAVGIAFLWSNSSLEAVSLQFISFLIFIYLSLQFLSKRIVLVAKNKLVIDFILITLAVYLIVFATGALFSPVFFLVYFLLFGISLLFEPSAAFSLAIISAAFLLLTPRKEFWPEILQLFSLFLISPLATIFGTQYINLQQSEKNVEMLKKQEGMLVSEVVNQEKEVKKWTFGDFRQRLIKIWENIDQIASDPQLLDRHKQKLSEMSNQLSNLLKSADEMEKKVSK
jgi:hypothetical protein